MDDTLDLYNSLALVNFEREREGEVVIYRKGGVYTLSISSDGLTHTLEISGKCNPPTPIELRSGEELWFEFTMNGGAVVKVYFDDEGMEFYQKYVVCSWLASGSIARMKCTHKPGVGPPLTKQDLLRVNLIAFDIRREGWCFSLEEKVNEKCQLSLAECVDQNSILAELVGSKKRERLFIAAPARDANFEGCTDATLYYIEITRKKHGGVISPNPSDDDIDNYDTQNNSFDPSPTSQPPPNYDIVNNGNGSLQPVAGLSLTADRPILQTEISVTPPASYLPNVSLASKRDSRKKKKEKKQRDSYDLTDDEAEALLPVAMNEGRFPLSVSAKRRWPSSAWSVVFSKIVFAINHPAVIVLRILGYISLLILWVIPDSSVSHHSLPKEYGPALLGTMWVLLVLQEILSLYKYRSISRTFLASLSHRNNMVNKQCCKQAVHFLNSYQNYVLLAFVFSHWTASLVVVIVNMSDDNSRQVSEAILLPLGLLTMYSTMLHFRSTSVIQWSILGDTVPPLEVTAKARFDFAVSQGKGWRSAIESSSAMRLLQLEMNKSWGWILLFLMLNCTSAIAWGVRLRYENKSDNIDLLLASFFVTGGVYFWLLCGWNSRRQSMLTNFLNHYEWRISEQASHLRIQFDPSTWSPTLSYFTSLNSTPIGWKIANAITLPDAFYAVLVFLCLGAAVTLVVDISTGREIFPSG